ncbi:hypothetical protein [Metabacillus sp. SLBN-84]
MNKKAKITIKIFASEEENGEKIRAVFELDGSDHDIMDLAEIAQSTGVIGEFGMDKLLRHVLNEDGDRDLSSSSGGALH